MPTFFEQQDHARRKTRALVWLMALAVLGMASSLYGLLLAMQQWAASRATSAPSTGPAFFQAQLFLACFGGTAVVVTLASLSRVQSLRGGGARVAEMLGGRLVSGHPRDGLERRLLNVVEEMAIASGVPVPQVFVLDDEPAINAFAAGFSTDDAVVTVTRGSLEKLSRDELQGVVAHELSHVLNGDMRLNMRLMGIVFGIVCVGLLGRFMMRVVGADGAYVSRRREGPGPVIFVFVFGLGVFLIGLVGELFGKLIKAAVSRQREFLADASAVQFTRNPQGIAGALKKIGGLDEGSRITSARAEEASHFFFGDVHSAIYSALWVFDVFATHPPLRERIVRIDPSFHGEFPEVGPGVAEPEEALAAGLAGGAPATPASPPAAALAAGAVVSQVGSIPLDGAARGRRLIDALPAALRDAVETPFAACATVYALLLADEGAVQPGQWGQIDAHSGPRMRVETLRLLDAVRALSRGDRLPLVALAAPALRRLSSAQRTAFAATVQALIEADKKVSIFEYVLAQTLRTRMADEGSAQERSRVRYRALADVGAELQLLLSLLAHAGDVDGGSAAQALSAGAARLPGVDVALLPPSEQLLPGLGVALENLSALAPPLCAQVVDACAHVVLADRRVTEDEETLLRAVCDALGSPLPALR